MRSPVLVSYAVAVPFNNQLLLDTVAPPIIATIWFVLSRGWAHAVQGAEVSKQTKKRQAIGFFVVLGLLYILMFTATLYLHFRVASS